MTDEQIVLARRAVACKNWRWMPGMKDQFERRVMWVYPDDGILTWSHIPQGWVPVPDSACIPDLSDAATRGALLGRVREVVEDPGAAVWRGTPTKGRTDYWEVSNCPACLPRVLYGAGSSEEEALVFALLDGETP